MAIELNVNENISKIFDKLEKFLTTKTVIGEPIIVGDATLIPCISVSFGLGSGGGDGNDEKGIRGVGGGAGVGAKVCPTAVIVIKGDKIELLPMRKFGGFEKLLEMVPDLVTKMHAHDKDKDQDECCK
jgi:uncharacterized spore protein YtfJ